MSTSSTNLMVRLFLALATCCTLATRVANGQQTEAEASAGQEVAVDSGAEAEEEQPVLQYIAPRTIEMLVGLKFTAPAGNVLGTMATTVFPTSWPEQKVEIAEVQIHAPFRHSFRDLPGGNKQLLLMSQLIPANSVQEATIRLRIEKSHIVGPEDTAEFTVPRRLPREVKMYMGNSPYIESNAAEVRRVVKEIQDQDPLTEWKKIEMLYDWVRDNINYVRGDLKSVRQAMKDGTGDCEEMTSTFVALCRASRVPARVVWIPNHCYPEFYMQDKEGNGHWFPCQVAGTRNFGSMPEYLPILQKGDRFKVPEKTEQQRYIADFLKAKKIAGRGNPKVEFIRQLLGDAANIRSPDLGQ